MQVWRRSGVGGEWEESGKGVGRGRKALVGFWKITGRGEGVLAAGGVHCGVCGWCIGVARKVAGSYVISINYS